MRPTLPRPLRTLTLIAGVLTAVVLATLVGVLPAHADGPPGTPTLSAPANGTMTMTTTSTLSWTQPSGASPGTTVYTVALSDWDTNQNLPALTTTTTSLAVPASEALQPGQRYFWSVNACNGSNCSATSGSWQVFVTPPSGAPRLRQPERRQRPDHHADARLAAAQRCDFGQHRLRRRPDRRRHGQRLAHAAAHDQSRHHRLARGEPATRAQLRLGGERRQR